MIAIKIMDIMLIPVSYSLLPYSPCRIRVSFESRYGMCLRLRSPSSPKALITLPSAKRPLFMFIPVRKREIKLTKCNTSFTDKKDFYYMYKCPLQIRIISTHQFF